MTAEEGIEAEIAVNITSPTGNRVKVHIRPVVDAGLPGYVVDFTPTELGDYLLNITFGGTALSRLPYRLRCLPSSGADRVHAFGSGLSAGIAGRPAEFIIDTRRAGQGGLGVTVEGPSEATLRCRDNGDGTCSVAYLPTAQGDYSINITFNEELICGSPFIATVVNEVDVAQIRIVGAGIQRHGRPSGSDPLFFPYFLPHQFQKQCWLQVESKLNFIDSFIFSNYSSIFKISNY